MLTLVVGTGPTSAQTPTPTGTATPDPTPTPSESSAAGVTLKASHSIVTFGGRVRLFGTVDPPVQGETVSIIDENGRTRATAITNARGRYSTTIRPPRNTTLTARWLVALSTPVTVRVRPVLKVHIGKVILFGRAQVIGRVAPLHPDDRVTLRLVRNGRTIRSRRAPLNRSSRFNTSFAIHKPGAYRVRAAFDDADHVFVVEKTTTRETPLPSLNVGSKGSYVARLERRLDELGYHLEGIDASYDRRTYDAVIAFNKVQGRTRYGSVSASTWRALAEPKIPRPRADSPRVHIEVDQTKQVLYVVKDGRVRNILHVSTGAGGATRDGVFHFFREINGYSGGGLYLPTYFDGLRAIHGWPEVPTYNASHGCVRVPMWAARWIFEEVELGDEIRIYH
ncbi:MAG: L,D-transpeptidase family protein [Actinomycetota bacterium]|nr:L,D-transpeptidase family protein [Actinomycetota bacterium]